jgi:hypothetical protein
LIITVTESGDARGRGPTLICASAARQHPSQISVSTQSPVNQDLQHRPVSIAGDSILLIPIMSVLDDVRNF